MSTEEAKIPLPRSLQEIVGALLFASEQPLTANDLRICVRGVEPEEGENAEVMGVYQSCTSREIDEALHGLEKELERSGLGFRLVCSAGAYRLQTTPSCEQIRGVAVDAIVKTLLDLGLVRLVGRSELPGHPFLYGTTQFFLEHFGLASLGDLDGIDPTLQRANPRARAAAYKKPEQEKTELELAAEEELAAAEAAKATAETPPPAEAEKDEEAEEADETDAEGVVYSADVPADGKETSDDEDFFIDDTPDEFDDEDEDDDEEDEDDDEEDEDDDDADEDEDEEDDDDE